MSNEEILLQVFPDKYALKDKDKNIVLVCDASFSINGSKAGLGVYDTFCKKGVYNCIRVGTSEDAEYMACKMALSYAMDMRYEKIKLVYDCNNINDRLFALGHELQDNFKSLVFECNGRRGVRPAHRIAKQALKGKKIVQRNIHL